MWEAARDVGGGGDVGGGKGWGDGGDVGGGGAGRGAALLGLRHAGLWAAGGVILAPWRAPFPVKGSVTSEKTGEDGAAEGCFGARLHACTCRLRAVARPWCGFAR